jgi:RNA polymerase sigma-70 factor (ECF subfamily)
MRFFDVERAELGAIARVSREAMARMYHRYAPGLVALGVRMLGEREEAEDVVHDVFLEAWRRADSYDPQRGSVSSWLLVRMRSRVQDRRRSPARRRVMLAGAPAAAAPPFDETAIAAPRERIAGALAALPHAQRVVLEMAYVEGLSAAEVAARIGIPVGTVKSRLAAALGKLRAALGTTRADAGRQDDAVR